MNTNILDYSTDAANNFLNDAKTAKPTRTTPIDNKLIDVNNLIEKIVWAKELIAVQLEELKEEEAKYENELSKIYELEYEVKKLREDYNYWKEIKDKLIDKEEHYH